MSRGSNPNSLKNLESTRWKPGQSGNPSGRPKGHVYPSNFLAGLLALNPDSSPKYTEADLEAILADPAAAPALKLACRWIVTGLKSGERWVLGKDGELHPSSMDPVPLRALESLADRQEGKPHQSVHVQRTEVKPPAEIGADIAVTLAALLTVGPEVLAKALANMEPAARARAVAMMPVDGEARVLPTL